MATFLFVTWEGGGNVNPVLGLTARLVERGHAVRVLGPASVRERAEAAGAVLVERDAAVEWDAAALAADVTVALAGVDVVVVDYMLPTALCAAEASGRPAAALVHTLFGALVVDGEFGTMQMAATVAQVNEVRAGLGLAPVERMADLLGRVDRTLVLAPAELDDPVHPGAVYCGPVPEDAGPDAGWAPLGEGPLVAVSLGTTPMDEGPVLQRVLDAVAALPVQVLATVGDHLDPAAFSAGPNTTVSRTVRHAAVLPHAAVLVTHAGLGSVLAGLAWRVPMVCLPLGREQPVNAAAVARLGAGRVLPIDADPAAIRAAVVDALSSTPPAVPVDPSGQRCVDALESLAG